MNKFSILVADPLAEAGLEILRESGAEVHLLTAEERPNLATMVRDFDALIVRSATKVDAELLGSGSRLRVVGRAGIGVDNVDVAAATNQGILVVNAPTANLISATEHTFAMLLALVRNVSLAHDSVRQGEWERKRFQGTELQGKTLGIVGLGRIGQSVAFRARAFGMTVIAFDPYLDASAARRFDVEMMPLEQVLAKADMVTIHTPLTEQTRNLISREMIGAMKRGGVLVNCARGGIVDEDALLEALDSDRLSGAALDVFAQEPPEDPRLSNHPKVVATPHIGAQTHEAQERVATETARMVLGALAGSLAVTAVNLPFVAASGVGEPFMILGEQLGRLASALLGSSLVKVQVELWGVEESVRIPVTIAALKGALTPFLGEAVNFVNAEKVAEGRSIEVVRSIHLDAGEYSHLVRVRLRGEAGLFEVAGTVFGDTDPRVVQFEGYRLEFRPKGNLLVLRNQDVPGVVGKIGSLLGEAGANIAEIHLARHASEGEAMAVIRLDESLSPETLSQLLELPEVYRAQMIDLGGF